VSSETDPDGTTTSYNYNGAGQITSQVVSFGSYSATTEYAYDSYGRQFCTVAPYEYAKGVRCPASPPSSPPTPSSDPYLGATITTFDTDGRVVQLTNPLGGIAYTAYDQAGEQFCSVAPPEAAVGVTCPSSAPSSPPTTGTDPYLGATITTYDGEGRPVQVTNPLGGITLTQYDAAGNVLGTTGESNNATADPNVVTFYTYDADNRVVSTTVDPTGGSLASTTLQAYDPDGNVYCSVSANAYAAGASAYQCPPWQPGWVSSPPSPSSLYSSTPTSAQANNVTTTFYDANSDELQSTDPDVHTSISVFDGDGRTYCSSDPTNVSPWLTSNPFNGPGTGIRPWLCDHDLRSGRAGSLIDRPSRRHDQLHLRSGGTGVHHHGPPRRSHDQLLFLPRHKWFMCLQRARRRRVGRRPVLSHQAGYSR
jgi:YD repeat-containing protein